METQKKRGKRGTARPSRNKPLAKEHRNTQSTSALVIDSAKYFECAEVEETKEEHLIPRESLTSKLFLRAFPQKVELEPRATRKLEYGKLTTVDANRVTWRSDKTLLRRSKPESQLPDVKREGVIREGIHTRKFIASVPGDRESLDNTNVLGPAFDDDIDVEL